MFPTTLYQTLNSGDFLSTKTLLKPKSQTVNRNEKTVCVILEVPSKVPNRKGTVPVESAPVKFVSLTEVHQMSMLEQTLVERGKPTTQRVKLSSKQITQSRIRTEFVLFCDHWYLDI